MLLPDFLRRDAVEPRNGHIRDDEVDPIPRERLDKLLPGIHSKNLRLDPFCPQRRLHDFRIMRLILEMENMKAIGHRRLSEW